ncbi:glycosyltransferase [Sphingomonas histidinilytica]|uniref:glycosyltransferase family 2 protein n=1 Tax=Rhizorhabdus histidinilytica TaxID=439228 RepID=UPI0022A87995|nr:glycosyltransferase family 2 protein [Rhizorhabdus histidinilytica]MBO9378989.1 glycosyltransferase [Rhizorhabdus histidinilytica]
MTVSKYPVLLSICIATYNRCDMVVPLVCHLLRSNGDFEICVHVDGSTDGTIEALRALSDDRLRVTCGSNVGRAGALMTACRASRGKFIMLFDDDDELFDHGLRHVLDDCNEALPDDVAGYIYHLNDEAGLLGTIFPVDRTNFLALRSDYSVRGDKKEVVRSNIFLEVAYPSDTPYRRIPTSLIWSRIALNYDIICRNLIIGKKQYVAGGITSGVKRIKRENVGPMVDLYRTHLRGFYRKRFHSWTYMLRSLSALIYYYIVRAKKC